MPTSSPITDATDEGYLTPTSEAFVRLFLNGIDKSSTCPSDVQSETQKNKVVGDRTLHLSSFQREALEQLLPQWVYLLRDAPIHSEETAHSEVSRSLSNQQNHASSIGYLAGTLGDKYFNLPHLSIIPTSWRQSTSRLGSCASVAPLHPLDKTCLRQFFSDGEATTHPRLQRAAAISPLHNAGLQMWLRYLTHGVVDKVKTIVVSCDVASSTLAERTNVNSCTHALSLLREFMQRLRNALHPHELVTCASLHRVVESFLPPWRPGEPPAPFGDYCDVFFYACCQVHAQGDDQSFATHSVPRDVVLRVLDHVEQDVSVALTDEDADLHQSSSIDNVQLTSSTDVRVGTLAGLAISYPMQSSGIGTEKCLVGGRKTLSVNRAQNRGRRRHLQFTTDESEWNSDNSVTDETDTDASDTKRGPPRSAGSLSSFVLHQVNAFQVTVAAAMLTTYHLRSSALDTVPETVGVQRPERVFRSGQLHWHSMGDSARRRSQLVKNLDA